MPGSGVGPGWNNNGEGLPLVGTLGSDGARLSHAFLALILSWVLTLSSCCWCDLCGRNLVFLSWTPVSGCASREIITCLHPLLLDSITVDFRPVGFRRLEMLICSASAASLPESWQGNQVLVGAVAHCSAEASALSWGGRLKRPNLETLKAGDQAGELRICARWYRRLGGAGTPTKHRPAVDPRRASSLGAIHQAGRTRCGLKPCELCYPKWGSVESRELWISTER